MKNIFDQFASSVPPSDPIETQPTEAAHAELEHHPAEDPKAPPTSSHTSPELKAIVQELLKHGYLEESHRPDLFRRTIIQLNAVNHTLEPLDLLCRVDTYRGVAFLAIANTLDPASNPDQAWSHPLVKRQRLTLEQSLLVAMLRQMFILHEQELGVGQAVARIAIDDLLPHFLVYFGDSGSDAKNDSRLSVLLDQLKTYGIVSEVDKNNEITIRPLIAHLANPESLQELLHALTRCRDRDPLTRGDA